jgi:hypothetical protein
MKKKDPSAKSHMMMPGPLFSYLLVGHAVPNSLSAAIETRST